MLADYCASTALCRVNCRAVWLRCNPLVERVPSLGPVDKPPAPPPPPLPPPPPPNFTDHALSSHTTPPPPPESPHPPPTNTDFSSPIASRVHSERARKYRTPITSRAYPPNKPIEFLSCYCNSDEIRTGSVSGKYPHQLDTTNPQLTREPLHPDQIPHPTATNTRKALQRSPAGLA